MKKDINFLKAYHSFQKSQNPSIPGGDDRKFKMTALISLAAVLAILVSSLGVQAALAARNQKLALKMEADSLESQYKEYQEKKDYLTYLESCNGLSDQIMEIIVSHPDFTYEGYSVINNNLMSGMEVAGIRYKDSVYEIDIKASNSRSIPQFVRKIKDANYFSSVSGITYSGYTFSQTGRSSSDTGNSPASSYYSRTSDGGYVFTLKCVAKGGDAE